MHLILRMQKTIAALTTSVVGAAIVFLSMSFLPSHVGAQSTAVERNESLTFEVNPFRGSITYSRFRSEQWELGLGLGFGFPQLDQTLFRGKTDDFRDYLNVSALARRHYGKRALLELSARIGVADYQRCEVSDCWPRAYFGPSVLFAVGGERFKVGPRVTFGEISHPSGDLDVFASVSPINLLVQLRW